MSVKVSESAVRGIIRSLFESGFDKEPVPAVINEPPVEEPPIEPSMEIGTDGVFELPPVNDEGYSPGTREELAKAAYAVAKEVPSNHVEHFWNELDKLSAEAETWQEDETMKKSIEEKLRRQIRKVLLEARRDGKPTDNTWGVHNRGAGVAWDDPDPRWSDDEEDEEVEIPYTDTMPGERGHEATWQELADLEGFKSPSGAKQFVDDPGRLMDRTRFLMTMHKNDPAAFESMLKDAVNKYADTLLKDEVIDPEDAEYLKANPEHTQKLDSFRVFLKKHVMRLMRKDPEIQAHITGRKEKRAAERAARKAARAQKKRAKKLGSMV